MRQVVTSKITFLPFLVICFTEIRFEHKLGTYLTFFIVTSLFPFKIFNTLTATAIFRNLVKRRQFDFFHINEYEITRIWFPRKESNVRVIS